MSLTLCIDARLILSGGIGTYLSNIIPQLPFDLTLLTPSTFPDWLKSYRCIPCDAPLFSLKEQLLLPLLIPPCDIFWSPHFNVPFLPVRSRKRLVTIHDTYHLSAYSTLKPWEKHYARFLYSRAWTLSSHCITGSQFSQMELEKQGAPTHKISIIPHAADYSRFFPAAQEKEKFFLYIGRDKAYKNLRNLLLAFENDFQDYTLIVIGEKQTLAHPRIQWRMHVNSEELTALYQRASLCIVPSFYEGFGLPALEAMQSGCSVVASHIPPLIEVCGDAATYVDPHNPHDIARGMKEALLKSGINGIVRSREFSWEKSVKSHITLMESL